MIKVISFSFYYSKLLLGVTLGIRQTAHPLGIKWRWNFWQQKYAVRRKSKI